MKLSLTMSQLKNGCEIEFNVKENVRCSLFSGVLQTKILEVVVCDMAEAKY